MEFDWESMDDERYYIGNHMGGGSIIVDLYCRCCGECGVRGAGGEGDHAPRVTVRLSCGCAYQFSWQEYSVLLR